ncbi:hypothetical protein, partial [Caulobacter sp.]|uniref:hypothetical protein n=1 Tax=Caulobacter sp. TaxID=78 RepID=UPI003BAEA808
LSAGALGSATTGVAAGGDTAGALVSAGPGAGAGSGSEAPGSEQAVRTQAVSKAAQAAALS